MKITLIRAEGQGAPTKPAEFNTFGHADELLSSWSRTAPEHGGYDKCDFKIVHEQAGFTEAEPYVGRYDLKNWRVHKPNLKAHVLDWLGFCSGREDLRPAKFATQEEYLQTLDRMLVTPDMREQCWQAYQVIAREV
ncbi:hypothetical protein [Chitinibacter tainanensis]|uniref:hypothetical protein n=1 Tax=Chitinibacter tainanensis TaxID=230667 RepID=UPI000416AAE6|nr:hypothetical protein [Chitinibacter tainanensis]